MRLRKIIVYLILFFIVVILWEVTANTTVRLLISKPSMIFDYFVENISFLLEALSITFYESIMGLIIATLFAFGIMIICIYFPKLMDYVLPIMIGSQVIPLITLAPLFILVFGIGVTAKIMMAALMSFFPIFVNFATGIKQISSNINELVAIYNISKTKKIIMIYFPLSLPNIMTGLKIAATLSVIGSIVGEFNGTELGLGKNLFLAAKRLEPELMMSSLILSTILGGFMYLLIYFIELKIGKWYLK